ncbi:hypothetical protein BYT27DRAFT_7191591 [Phlegmacium glaucopus]|nr:hypothetical protein BYT27DRAFT_7191591 [Phlegmacium glaucopus]
MSTNQPTAVRGRNPASKPLKASSTAATTTTSKPSRTPSANSTVSATSDAAGESSSAPRTPSRGSESGRMKVTKLSSTTVTLPTTWAQKTPASEPPKIEEQPQTRTSDPLQIAAQMYPWSFMTSTLDACFKNAEAAATNDLETRAKELDAEEAKIADQRERFEAERAIGILHELGSEAFANEAPAVMQLFYSHGISCDRIETEALKLSAQSPSDTNEDEPLKVYNDMLDSLEALQKEATNLESLITKLTNTPSTTTTVEGNTPIVDGYSPQSQIIGVFAACLPILRARIANLSLAQELIDGILENASLRLRMESMGIV